MPKRVPVQTVILHRDGKQFAPPLGKAFDFTAEELADINAVNPDAVRKPVVEDGEAAQNEGKTGAGNREADDAAADQAAAEAKLAAAEKAAKEAKAQAGAKGKAGDKGGDL